MANDKYLLAKWQQILDRVEKNNGNVSPIILGEKAAFQEITEKEQELGYELPPSYKHILLNIAKSLSFYYSFSDDTMIPNEFREIFSGELNWDISCLQNLDLLADDLMNDEHDYGKALRGKVEFTQSGNGDIYAFDMSVETFEKPVVYWDHEENTLTYIADSFIDYLMKLTELGCIGSEKWQFEYFLSEKGIETTSPAAGRWKQWFESFSETRTVDVKNDMDQLVSFIIYRNYLDDESIQYLGQFNQKELFNYLLKELHKREAYQEQKVLCNILGKVLGGYIVPWLKSLWESNEVGLDPRLRSYLTSMCLNEEPGLSLVFQYLQENADGKIYGYDALFHLEAFQSREVISWMEDQVHFPVTEGWSQLFLVSNLSWNDIKKWSQMEEKHEVTMIHALETFVHTKLSEPVSSTAISDLPQKEELQDFLYNLRDKQVLRKRVQAVKYILENLDVFYVCS